MSSLQQISSFIEALQEVVNGANKYRESIDNVRNSMQKKHDSMCMDYIKKLSTLKEENSLLKKELSKQNQTKIFVNGEECS